MVSLPIFFVLCFMFVIVSSLDIRRHVAIGYHFHPFRHPTHYTSVLLCLYVYVPSFAAAAFLFELRREGTGRGQSVGGSTPLHTHQPTFAEETGIGMDMDGHGKEGMGYGNRKPWIATFLASSSLYVRSGLSGHWIGHPIGYRFCAIPRPHLFVLLVFSSANSNIVLPSLI